MIHRNWYFVHIAWFCSETALYLLSEACEKERDQSVKLSRDTIMSHHSPQAFPVNTVKCLPEIHEDDVQRHILTLLNDVSHDEDNEL